jgi:hypothetical protein
VATVDDQRLMGFGENQPFDKVGNVLLHARAPPRFDPGVRQSARIRESP